MTATELPHTIVRLQNTMDTVTPPSREATEQACAISRAEGLTAV